MRKRVSWVMRLWMALPRAIEHSGEKMLHLDFNPPFLEKRKQLLNMKHLQSRQMLGPGTGHGLQVQLRMAYTPSRIARASRHTLTPQLHPRLGAARTMCFPIKSDIVLRQRSGTLSARPVLQARVKGCRVSLNPMA